MSDENSSPEPGGILIDHIKRNAGATIWCGALLIAAGTLALLSPLVAGLSITIMVGVMLALSGVGQCFLAFKTDAFGKGLIVFLVGLLMAMAGFYMMSQPVAGLASLTLILMAYLLATGAMEIFVALQLRPAPGWGVQMFSGVITLVLGLMLWRQFPLSGVWAIGVLFGIKMIFSGWAFVFIGRAVKGVAKEAS